MCVDGLAWDDSCWISGLEYQHGTLFGSKIREYLLAKWNRTCSYCGAKEIPLSSLF